MEREGKLPSFSFLFVGIVQPFVGSLLNLTPIILGDSEQIYTFALASGQVIGGGAPMSDKDCE